MLMVANQTSAIESQLLKGGDVLPKARPVGAQNCRPTESQESAAASRSVFRKLTCKFHAFFAATTGA